MSPGLYGTPYPAWSLVEVNPSNGTITKVFDVAPEGKSCNSFIDKGQTKLSLMTSQNMIITFSVIKRNLNAVHH